ncbi:unnamed protein product [Auanema sp. JU1783]|nr:unnamed protein product [Auanema sp. JU1783]
MLDGSDYMSMALHCIISLGGGLCNVFLIFLVLTSTPAILRSYSMLILNAALTDALACFSSLFTMTRIIPAGPALTYVFHGPCQFFGAEFCYYTYCFLLHTLAHSLFVILASFIYRNHVISEPNLRARAVCFCLLLVYLPSFTQFILFCISLGDLDKIMAILHEAYPHYDFTGLTIAGNEKVLSPIVIVQILYVTVPSVPVYIAITLIRRNIYNTLKEKSQHFSEATIRTHKQLAKALTIQACLPATFVIAVTFYTSLQLDIYRSPIFEKLVFVIVSCVPMGGPFVSIYFIKPYREKTLELLGKSKEKTMISISTVSNSYKA